MTRNNDTSRDDDDAQCARRFRRCDMTIYRCVGNRVSIVDASSFVRRFARAIVRRDASRSLRVVVVIDNLLHDVGDVRALRHRSLLARAYVRDTYLIAFDDAIDDDATLNVREHDIDVYDERVFVACASYNNACAS